MKIQNGIQEQEAREELDRLRHYTRTVSLLSFAARFTGDLAFLSKHDREAVADELDMAVTILSQNIDPRINELDEALRDYDAEQDYGSVTEQPRTVRVI